MTTAIRTRTHRTAAFASSATAIAATICADGAAGGQAARAGIAAATCVAAGLLAALTRGAPGRLDDADRLAYSGLTLLAAPVTALAAWLS